jgi:hypothetical protein
MPKTCLHFWEEWRTEDFCAQAALCVPRIKCRPVKAAPEVQSPI